MSSVSSIHGNDIFQSFVKETQNTIPRSKVNTYTIEIHHTYPTAPSHQDTVLSVNDTLLHLLSIGVHIKSSPNSEQEYNQSSNPQEMLNDININMDDYVLGLRSHHNKSYYRLNIAIKGTLFEVKKYLSSWCSTNHTRFINTTLKSTSNCTIGWLAYLHPQLTYNDAIISELQSRLNTTIPFELKRMPIKLKHATTWGLSVRCAQSDSRALETLLCSLIPSTKEKALYSESTYFSPFNPTPSIPPNY